MIWIAMTIPDDPARLADWLEAQLVGQNLGKLVAELRAVHGDQPTTQSLNAILGNNATTVLESGLGILPHSVLQELLRNPSLLLELQEQVLMEGGPYWSELPMSEEFGESLERGWERLRREVVPQLAVPAPPIALPTRQAGLLRKLLPYAVTSLATAAAILVAFHFVPINQQQDTAKAWGWQKPDAFPTNLDRVAYLNRLADEADEWFNKRPDNVAAAAKRISEFREGCTALLLAEHSPLTPADRIWLKERCQKWSQALDSTLAKLEENRDVVVALGAADETAKKLSRAIRDRAAA
ncbi:MAG TPA: hypothetical protein VG097_14885 [Gemmata sp.]|jgi:hypothetical protein|nr:hypothetical protein [Gemmata sp.]